MIFRSFLEKNTFTVEEANIENGIENNFKCQDCGKQCKNEKHYKSHRYYHENTLNGPHINCVECNKEIPEKLYARHMKRVHQKTKSADTNEAEFWNIDFFLSMKKSSLRDLKRHWKDFCRRSYHEQQNPPSEEIYADYFRQGYINKVD